MIISASCVQYHKKPCSCILYSCKNLLSKQAGPTTCFIHTDWGTEFLPENIHVHYVHVYNLHHIMTLSYLPPLPQHPFHVLSALVCNRSNCGTLELDSAS